MNTRNESSCKEFIYSILPSESRQNKKSYVIYHWKKCHVAFIYHVNDNIKNTTQTMHKIVKSALYKCPFNKIISPG